MKRSALLAIAGLAAVAAAASYQAFTPKLVVKVGDVSKYHLTVALSLQGQDFEIKANTTEKITKVSATEYQTEESQTDTTVNGNTAPGGAEAPTTFTANLRGEVIKIEGTTTSPAAYRLSNLNTFFFPDKEIKVGDTWKRVGKADDKTGAVATEATFTYKGDEKVDKYDTFRVESVAKETAGDAPATMTTTFWMSKTDGSLIKLKSKGTNIPLPGLPAPSDVTVEEVRYE